MFSTELETKIKSASQTPYPISTPVWSTDCRVLQRAINQGIDSHLEAVQFTQRIADGRLEIEISPDTLHVLVRRLLEANFCDDSRSDFEHDTDNCTECELEQSSIEFASCILQTLDIELF